MHCSCHTSPLIWKGVGKINEVEWSASCVFETLFTLTARPCSLPSRETPASAVPAQLASSLGLLALGSGLWTLYLCIRHQIKISWECDILCYSYNVCARDEQCHYIMAAVWLEWQNFWPWAKHGRLYSDLLQNVQRKRLMTGFSSERELWFLQCQVAKRYQPTQGR